MTAKKNNNIPFYSNNQDQNILANHLLDHQEKLLILLYNNQLLTEYIKDYNTETVSQWGTSDWNRFKKEKKLSLSQLTHLVDEIQTESVKQEARTISKYIITLRIDIVHSFIPLIQFLAKRYAPYNYSLYLDLRSEGYIGLLKSLESFYYIEPSKSIKTYSTFYIKQEMRRFLLENRQGFKIPYIASIKQKKDKESHTINYLEISKVQYFMDLNTQFENYEYMIPSDINDPFYKTWETSLEKIIQNTLHRLTPNEKKVLELRYGINTKQKELSLAKIGVIMNLSKERIRQIEKKALKQLYKEIKLIIKKEDLYDKF